VAKVSPVFLMSAVACVLSIWTVKLHANINNPYLARSWPERIATAGDVVWFYLGKLLWPHPLIFIYPRWEIDTGRWLSYLPLLLVIVISFALWLKCRSWLRSCFFASAYFLAALLPVLGLVDQYFWRYSFVGDHFQYLAAMGPLALVGAGLVRLSEFIIPKRPWLQSSLCAGLLLILGGLSWQRTWAYESMETLWTDTLAQNPDCWMAYNNLGPILEQKGQMDKAMIYYQKALEINPNYAEAHNNLGNDLIQMGRVNEALVHFQRAVEIDPNLADAQNSLAHALFQTGHIDEALAHYQRALEINPSYTEPYNNFGGYLLQKGDLDGAIAQFQKALKINPDDADAYCNLGNALSQKGQIDEAMIWYQKALKINPNDTQAHNNLGNDLLQKGQVDEAMVQFQEALEINPNFVEARNNLGNTFFQKGRFNEAADQYQRALIINPNIAQIHLNLGITLSKMGQLDEAIVQFQETARLQPGNDAARKILAKAEMIARQKADQK
jgi:tetratricopeptide (TPR) repeat protein